MQSLQKLEFFGWQWVAESKNRLQEYLENHLGSANAGLLAISTANPEQVMFAKQESKFFNTIKDEFDLILPDGEGIVLASRMLSKQARGTKLKERLAGVEIVTELLSQSRLIHGPMLLIGGKGYTSSKIQVGASELVFREIPETSELQVGLDMDADLFWLPAYEDVKHPTASEEERIESVIKKLRPRLVFVALGAPQQEFWVAEHKQLLANAGVRIVMVVGGAFDMLTGKVLRAPKLMRQLKLEWFWRLLQEPTRWRRQLALIKFIKYVCMLKFL